MLSTIVSINDNNNNNNNNNNNTITLSFVAICICNWVVLLLIFECITRLILVGFIKLLHYKDYHYLFVFSVILYLNLACVLYINRH